MWNLIKLGGVPPMLFILAVGLTSLGTAFYFALRPNRHTLGFIYGVAFATLFGTIAATCADVGATFNTAARVLSGEDVEAGGHKPPSEAEAMPRAVHIVIEGLGESTSPGVLGFPILALTAMLVGVGRRRLDSRPDVLGPRS